MKEIRKNTLKKVIYCTLVFAMIIGAQCVEAESLRADINTALTNTGQTIGVQTERTIGQVVGGVIQVALSLLGLIFLILLVYGGFRWMEAKGDEKKVTEARTLMFQAIIGLAITLSAYAIAYFFVKALLNAAGFPTGNPAP